MDFFHPLARKNPLSSLVEQYLSNVIEKIKKSILSTNVIEFSWYTPLAITKTIHSHKGMYPIAR